MDTCEDGAKIDVLGTLGGPAGDEAPMLVALDTFETSTDGVCLRFSPDEIHTKVSLERISEGLAPESVQWEFPLQLELLTGSHQTKLTHMCKR